MQSSDDDTLFACMDIEKRYKISQEQNAIIVPQKENGSNLDKYFKQNLSSLEFISDNDDDIDKSKQSHSLDNAKETEKKNESDFEKYFEDSIIFPKSNRKNFSLASSIYEQNKISQKSLSSKAIKKDVDTISSKYSSDVTSIIKKYDDSNTKDTHKDKTCNATYDNNTTLLISSICDKEGIIISSPPLCTQDRCKLASWGLPSNILQVLYHNFTFNNTYLETYLFVFISNHLVLNM